MEINYKGKIVNILMWNELQEFYLKNPNALLITYLVIYFLCIALFYLGKNNPFFASLVMKILYYTVGFPVLIIVGTFNFIWKIIFKILRLKSSKINNSNSNNSDIDKESIKIQKQREGGAWFDSGSLSAGTSDTQISIALNNAQNSTINAPGYNGRVRAIGEKTGRLYGMQ